MESGDGSCDNNKHVRNCETQTVVVSRNVSEVSVMADMQCGDINSNYYQITKVVTIDNNMILFHDIR